MFRFTIRDLALVMVCVSLAAGWWVDRRWLKANNNYLTSENTRREEQYLDMKKERSEALAVVRQAHNALQSYDAEENRRALKAARAIVERK